MDNIKENLKLVEDKILKACRFSGRNRKEINLIAVSKTKPVELIYEAYRQGYNTFGENKVQELIKKADQMSKEDIHWHMIGHLQLNKVKYLIGKVDMIESLDSEKLAREIEKQAAKKGVLLDVLCEVNVANEESKYGLLIEEVPKFMSFLSGLPHLKIRGLMTVAPLTSDPETNRPYFRTLKTLLEDINKKNIPGIRLDTLSMGMTGDYEIAIQEGATMVRIGTGIFGERNLTE